MSRTLKQSPPEKAYGSGRPEKGSQQPGKATKKIYHHRARRVAVREIAQQVIEVLP